MLRFPGRVDGIDGTAASTRAPTISGRSCFHHSQHGLASKKHDQRFVCKSDPRERTKWYGTYTEEQYLAQRQSEERARWAASVRTLTGNLDQAAWSREGSPLDPPALLSGVAVVIISPRKPVTVGTVARACGSFECEDLRIVMPRQESYITRRHAKSASKGAQYILYRAGHYDSIAEATADCDVRISFTRWSQSSSPHVCKIDISGLTSLPAVRRVVEAPLHLSPQPPPPPAAWTPAAAAEAEAAEARLAAAAEAEAAGVGVSVTSGEEAATDANASSDNDYDAHYVARDAQASASNGGGVHSIGRGDGGGHTSGPDLSSASVAAGQHSGASPPSGAWSGASPSGRPPKVALVFGREELGMSDEEVDSCEVCCSVPIGRLQESLSLSHAVSIALCALYQSRLQHLATSGQAEQVVGAAVGARSAELMGAAAEPSSLRVPASAAP